MVVYIQQDGIYYTMVYTIGWCILYDGMYTTGWYINYNMVYIQMMVYIL